MALESLLWCTAALLATGAAGLALARWRGASTLVYEFPQAEGDPYYPVPRPENQQMYRKYEALAHQTPGVHFLGRLGTYKYYNMDQCVAQALTYYRKVLSAAEELATTA